MVRNFSCFSNNIFIKVCYSDGHGTFLIISLSDMFPHVYTEKDRKKMSKQTTLSLKKFVSITFLLLVATAILAACGSSNSGTATASSSSSTSSSATTTQPSGPGGGSNARSGPAAGGAIGTVGSVSTSGFTLTTAGGQKVTINEASSTTYQNGTNSTSASAITNGESVLVLGTVNTTNGTTIAATEVIVQPAGSGGSAASSAAGVVPFQRGASSTSKQIGQIPANYSQGSGTIVSGTTANKATEAALAAYPGGIVDRVVQLSNGEYEVHNIGVNWPHHVFVNQDFKVVGAD
jgi:hypothetical protein